MVGTTQRPDRDTDIQDQNFDLFKDCLASRVLVRLSGSAQGDTGDSTEDLDEFSLYLAQEAWPTIPQSMRGLTYNTSPIPEAEDIPINISPTLIDTLFAYGILPSGSLDGPDPDAAQAFILHVLTSYIPLATQSPPQWSSTRTSECEICSRAVPLTYHHLVPRSMHERAVKRGWHPPEMLRSVAWLCRPCHSAVHAVASNEELAKEFYTLDRLLARPDIQRWEKYAAKQRWGARRG
ncbi:uncharacterized protein FOMMEDRAFT_91092 [Fomitiporia mediterranea MF3/22]|uniref:uncharacterized protein n=1 Tax=Fomitiporia mediterranea (strain MF3/22) TaxID=694068 RepID=UPI000440777E|nr:uncharacterized protein FOMMEDRAFT_91092 [Fomitiporia mediterranea MF3/22]EJD00548.1 hypothetical protein FOMMEDRAFT_91092 [Fomitiporia mediterranea MF3/22]